MKEAIEKEIKGLEKQIEYNYEGSDKRRELEYILEQYKILLRRFL